MKLLHRVHHVSCGEDVRLHSNPTKQYVQQKRQRQALGVHLLGKNLNILGQKKIRMKQTASESKCPDTASFHEHSHESFVRTNIVDGYFARGEADTNNVDCRRLDKSCYRMSMVIGACGCQVWRCQ
jgi:hypothetical protein